MLLIKCPYCLVERAEIEFAYAGEAFISRPSDPAELSDAQWEDYLYLRTNGRGTHFERWVHIHGCARYFNAVRDTVTDRFILTQKTSAPRPSAGEIAQAKTQAKTQAQTQVQLQAKTQIEAFE